MRKIASIQTIESIQPIPNADRIVVATMKNKAWKVIVGRDEFKVGDKVVYFETDAFLPKDNPVFTNFSKRGERKFLVEGEELCGHVLKTMKMRGVYSQGLILPLESFDLPEGLENDTEVTEKVGVYKYEEPLPNNTDIIGPFDTTFAPKTDSERVQNLTEVWEEIKKLEWTPTVKVDGTSQTLVYDEGFRVFGRNWELDLNTAPSFKIIPKDVKKVLKENPGLTIQYEFAGPKINGNRLGLSKPEIFIFSVWKNREKVNRVDWPEEFLAHSVPVVEYEVEGTVSEMLEKVETLRENIAKQKLDEGVVYHLIGAAPDGVPETFKIINNKYLTKHGL